MMDKVDEDQSGELEFVEFVKMMAVTNMEQVRLGSNSASLLQLSPVPFHSVSSSCELEAEFNSTVASFIDLSFTSNDVTFLGDAPGIVSSYKAFKLGRNNTDNQNSDFRVRNNSFTNISSVPVSFYFEPVKYVELNSASIAD